MLKRRDMSFSVAMFDSKEYDISSFDNELKLFPELKIKYYETRLTKDTVELAKGFDVICVFVNDEITNEVIDKLYKYGIKLIALRCAGFNNVDVKYCFGKIHVVRVPAYSPYAVAEHAMAMLLTINRRIHKAYIRSRDYNFSLVGLTGMDLHDKTIGVVGTGRIGRVFIDICKGFGMHVIAYDKYPSTDSNIEYTSLDDLYKRSDIISLHCPLTDENKYMLNKDSFALMKKGVIIINTSRGGLINSNDLLTAIKERKVGAACLDVYEEESDVFFSDKSGHILDDDTLARLISMPNVIVTSHQAFLTNEALNNIAHTTLKNIADFFDNKVNENELCYHCGKVEDCKKIRKDKCF